MYIYIHIVKSIFTMEVTLRPRYHRENNIAEGWF